MRLLALIVILASVAFGARADEAETWRPGVGWGALDTSLEAGCVIALALDWRQTMTPGRELNPLLGRDPSRARITGYFAGVAVMHAAVAILLPRPWRTAWQAVWIGIEGETVYRNARAGVQIQF